MPKIALINNKTSICENITIDNRPANQIFIEGYTAIDLKNTTVINWKWNESLNDFEEVETIGNGGIGYTYNFTNEILIAKKPEKPETIN